MIMRLFEWLGVDKYISRKWLTVLLIIYLSFELVMAGKMVVEWVSVVTLAGGYLWGNIREVQSKNGNGG